MPLPLNQGNYYILKVLELSYQGDIQQNVTFLCRKLCMLISTLAQLKPHFLEISCTSEKSQLALLLSCLLFQDLMLPFTFMELFLMSSSLRFVNNKC
jgi:hypothetical protein